eukprot:SAG31_NODE_12822_length_914_cov_1.053988_1_plen_50_part_01
MDHALVAFFIRFAMLGAAFDFVQLAAAQDHSCELASLFAHLNEIQGSCCD